jgi:hypothetical protein
MADRGGSRTLATELSNVRRSGQGLADSITDAWRLKDALTSTAVKAKAIANV